MEIFVVEKRRWDGEVGSTSHRHFATKKAADAAYRAELRKRDRAYESLGLYRFVEDSLTSELKEAGCLRSVEGRVR